MGDKGLPSPAQAEIDLMSKKKYKEYKHRGKKYEHQAKKFKHRFKKVKSASKKAEKKAQQEAHAGQAQAAQEAAEKKMQQEADSSTAQAATITEKAKVAQNDQGALEKEAARAKAAETRAEAEAAERVRSADQVLKALQSGNLSWAQSEREKRNHWAEQLKGYVSQAQAAENKETVEAAEQVHESQVEADRAVAMFKREEAAEKEEQQRLQVADRKAAKAAKTIADLRAQLKANAEVAGQKSFDYLDAAIGALLALLISGGLLLVGSSFFKKPVPKKSDSSGGPQAEHEELTGALQDLKKSLLEHKEDHEAEHAQRKLLEASLEVQAGDQQIVSDKIYMGEVVNVWGKCAWVKPETFSIMAIPMEVEHKLVKMNEEIRAKLKNHFPNDNVLYVRVSDVAETGLVLKSGVQIQFKLYTFNEGVGGCDIKSASFSRQL